MRIRKVQLARRDTEFILLVLTTVFALLSFLMATAALEIQAGREPEPALRPALVPPLVLAGLLWGLHIVFRLRRIEVEPLILPLTGLILAVGLVMIWRLRGPEGVWQQITRGLLPGFFLIYALILFPRLVEYLRRWSVAISLVGLALPMLTAVLGVPDETGARLAIKLGPLPAIQTSEFIKLALVIFLAWYVDRQGEAAEGRGRAIFGWLRLPALSYLIPGGLFVFVGTLALVAMSDFGAVLVLSLIFVGMLYAGFESRIFTTIASFGGLLALVVALVLSLTWEVPTVIQNRFLAFRDPWSEAELMIGGQPTGFTIAEGPGYQIQQAVYATVAGGVSGTGLGFGSPYFIPLASSDFIFAAILEEFGSAVSLALLAFFAIILLRVLRVAALLPQQEVFERLLLTGIAIHLFTQVLIMVGGTLNLFPLTGVTIPFLSAGGAALLVNLFEIGLALAIMQRLEGERS